MNQRLKKWMGWMKVIEGEVGNLVASKFIFQTVQGMIRVNPRTHLQSSFYEYFSQSYAAHSIIGLRRQLKCEDNSISMVRLFNEMIESPEALSREQFACAYQRTDWAAEDFNKFAAADAAHIDPCRVVEDRDRLKEASRRCEDFADKRIAHRDKRVPKQPPTFNEIDCCISLLDALYVKYHLLFFAAGMETLLPKWQYDWTAIFRVPWLPGDE